MRRTNLTLVAAGALLIAGGSIAYGQVGGAAGAGAGGAGAGGAGASAAGSASTAGTLGSTSATGAGSATMPSAGAAGSVGGGVGTGAVTNSNPALTTPVPGANANTLQAPTTGYNSSMSKTRKRTGRAARPGASSTLPATPGTTTPSLTPNAGAATSPSLPQ